MLHDDPHFPGPRQPGRPHVVLVPRRENKTADRDRQPRPAQHRENQRHAEVTRQRRPPRRHRRAQRHPERQRREAAHDFDQTLNDQVHAAPEIARNAAHHQADHEADRDADQSDRQRHARAVRDPAEEAPPDAVRSKREDGLARVRRAEEPDVRAGQSKPLVRFSPNEEADRNDRASVFLVRAAQGFRIDPGLHRIDKRAKMKTVRREDVEARGWRVREVAIVRGRIVR